MSKLRTVYIRPKGTPWESVFGGDVTVMAHRYGKSFMPIFDSLEEFEAAYPGEEPLIAETPDRSEE